MACSRLASVLTLTFVAATAAAQLPVHLTVEPASQIGSVSPTLYGLMTEEINYSYDGGLYAELVRNRTFQRNWSGFEYWNLSQEGTGRAQMADSPDGPSQALRRSVKLTVTSASKENEAGLINGGFWGMAVRPSTRYRGSFFARGEASPANLHFRLISDESGVTLAEAHVLVRSSSWTRYTYEMTTSASFQASSKNHLVLSLEAPGSLLLQLVSLFPPTFHERPNGNRPDLMQMMAEMHPHFLRLPGGNYLEGNTVKDRFDWKKTIGRQVDRPTHHGPWNYTSSDGLGLLELLEWCEDLKIEPLLAVFAGYTLDGKHVAGPELEPYIQDALDEIEYVTGGATTKWGAVRAADGHPAPFPLSYIEIGNEDDLDHSGSYEQRFAQFATAIRARYPQYKLIATTPVKSSRPDVVDDHYYKSPEEFFSLVHKYDNVSRSGPKIFVGEWATRIGSPTPNMAGALGDAAWMTSMERNSDLIVLSSYAPLFVNVSPGGMQWSPDLVGYDALQAYGSPSYWAQVLFSRHLGDYTVKSTLDREDGLFFYSSTVSADGKTLFVKLVNASERNRDVMVSVAGFKGGPVKLNTLHAASRWATNSLSEPGLIHPEESTVTAKSGSWLHTMPGNSIEVYDIPLQ